MGPPDPSVTRNEAAASAVEKLIIRKLAKAGPRTLFYLGLLGFKVGVVPVGLAGFLAYSSSSTAVVVIFTLAAIVLNVGLEVALAAQSDRQETLGSAKLVLEHHRVNSPQRYWEIVHEVELEIVKKAATS